MTTRKRNEWLDTGLSEDEDEQGYDSDERQDSRGALTGHSLKRRKVDNDESDDDSVIDDDDDDGEEVSSKPIESKTTTTITKDDAEDEDSAAEEDMDGITEHTDDDVDDDDTMEQATKKQKDSKLKPLTTKQLEKAQKAAKKTGVIYLSRIPPFMKPATLKHLLTPYGEVGRIFLTPEDPVQHQRRVRAGGNKKKSFTDGWVEFLSKKNAKIVAESLNGNIVGGKKGSFYHDDVWNIKYLKGFKWNHLTDQIANENAERAARLRAEISKTRRENKKFVEDVERAKMLEGMQAKKKAKQERAGGDVALQPAVSLAPMDERKRQFKQNQVKLKQAKDGAKAAQPDAVKRVLGGIF